MKPVKKELDRLVQEASKGKLCRICKQPAVCFHHIIRRDEPMARYDPLNLMPVCKHCHDEIHNGHIDEKLYLSQQQKDYLEKLKMVSYKDFLIFVVNMTENQYFSKLKKEWKEKNKKN